ncbi:UDP-N-acetylmuramoyl-tripeptide--D-alanyl-D-alanine ligase [Corynebacterium uberis]|uniref:UDP-N-acetylmuramoyl-tripeptide--D-alanyl-D- alanine ligase n=1 Tax=Corynebacterium TaxID=1716 RepID=UPI001D09A314|nr:MULTISPECIES: UDP-N-acetylmuramoyl-tripeptide--D-alanyl-D-alanine ligase [Corynebacterium]MCZ9308304.1 UDP-N-acetylmuramoyl-tripeptide--D-alanyl-D-alanine ligase [Corynebacterium sp. c6VSa_13]UDL73980.1 UDP-N-acetylmuramoyl-tripeptide--D-alanyl-D-alanine ligase [Corynebacterium uberis]UDL75136.1 UDP-N-acetylmuramoyl-tripeptide--D-alanyl-D-alanine ligase [Corynebacterium uberis]UDL77349.1 UDP-N-acetylmuramoyl-tripeptide--D-alanyl-D-alanine ligase [Corynebacterium uberis]UDL79633.1 UDP-N-acet
MIALTLEQIAAVVGGTLADVTDPTARVTGSVEFDSRAVTPGGLFVALAGEKVDGHEFARQAIDAGAVAVLAARPVGVPAIVVPPAASSAEAPAEASAEAPSTQAYALAHDTDGSAARVIGAMSALAHHVVTTLVAEQGLTVIGVTGSAGKTSTKDLTASVLEAAGPTVAPPGSFNNEIGHPYTALRCTESTRFLVAELSARGVGHVAALARIAPPRLGAVLNVGTAHLGEFGSRETIAQAKGELVEALPSAADGGVAVLNADDPLVAGMAARTSAAITFFSAEGAPGAQVWASGCQLDELTRASFDLHAQLADSASHQTAHVDLQVFGAHQVANALAAAALGLAAGLSIDAVAAALSHSRGVSAHRMDVRTSATGLTIINDSYNANPDSMAAGLTAAQSAAAAHPGARAIAVLGEMGELGEGSEAAHQELGASLAQRGIAHLIAYGSSPAIDALARGAEQAGVPTTRVDPGEGAQDQRQGPAAAAAAVRAVARPHDVVLVKASNAAALWRVAELLLADAPETLGGAPGATPTDSTDSDTHFDSEGC